MIRSPGETRFARVRARLEGLQVTPGPKAWAFEFLLFGLKQGWACLFGGLMLALLLVTHLFYPPDAPLHRYDLLTVAALGMSIGVQTGPPIGAQKGPPFTMAQG